MQSLAVKAYGEARRRTADDKQIEHALFTEVTEDLEKAQQDGESALAAWAEAINRNQQMWAVMTADVLHPENRLPKETRTALVHIAEFVRRHSLEILAGREKISDLIEVNRTIMEGLALTGNPVATDEGT